MDKVRKALQNLMREIFKAGEMPARLDSEVVERTAEKLMAGVEEGYGKKLVGVDYNTPDYDMMASLKNDVWQFSGAKNYQQMKAMTEALIGPDGSFRSYNEFKKAVRPIIGDHVEWLETEYRTAISSSQMAGKWVRINKDKKLFPYLQFDAIIDNRTTELCHGLNNTIKPVDDPFWDIYYPPNHFNCRSTVRQLQEGEVTPDSDIDFPEIPTTFRTNVAKMGLVFPPKSSYYIDLPDKVRKQSEDALGKLVLKQTKQKFKTANRFVKRPEFANPIEISNDGIKQLIQHRVQKHNGLKNIITYDIDDILESEKTKYLGRIDPNPKNADKVAATHLFKIFLKDEETLLLVNEYIRNGQLIPKSFSQNLRLKDFIK